MLRMLCRSQQAACQCYAENAGKASHGVDRVQVTSICVIPSSRRYGKDMMPPRNSPARTKVITLAQSAQACLT